MSIFNIGPDGLLLIEALLVSVFVAVLAWRRAGLTAGISATAVIAVALIVFNAMSPNATPGLNYRIVTALFVVVPSALCLARRGCNGSRNMRGCCCWPARFCSSDATSVYASSA